VNFVLDFVLRWSPATLLNLRLDALNPSRIVGRADAAARRPYVLFASEGWRSGGRGMPFVQKAGYLSDFLFMAGELLVQVPARAAADVPAER